jgi:hypothetical protein
MSDALEGNAINADKLVRIYIKMRDKRKLLVQDLEEKIEAIEEQMKVVKTALLDHCKATGAESIRTPNGIAFRTVRTLYTTADWENFYKFVVDNNAPHLLEKRVHQMNMKGFLEDNPDMLPPGLNSSSEYTITIRRK